MPYEKTWQNAESPREKSWLFSGLAQTAHVDPAYYVPNTCEYMEFCLIIKSS